MEKWKSKIRIPTFPPPRLACGARKRTAVYTKHLTRPDEALASVDWERPELVVVKLHGTIRDKDAVAITIRRVAAQQHIANRAKAVSELLSHLPTGGLLIFGYSFSDRFDVSPAISATTRHSGPLLCVNHVTGCDPRLDKLSDELPGHPLARFDAQLLTCNADELIDGLWSAVGVPPPSLAAPMSLWHTHVDEWLATVRGEGGEGMVRYVAGLMHKAANNWVRSSDTLTRALALGLPPTLEARAHLAVGNNARDHGDLETATQSLTIALQAAREHGQVREEARALNSIGMIAADKREHDLAREHYQRALDLAKRAGDLELEGKCYGNLGIATKNKGGPLHDAVALQEQALRISRELGDKRSEGRTLGNLGILQSCLGNKPSALTYYEQAGQVARDLGDQLHVAIWLHNYGEDAMESDPSRAEESLRQASSIFRSLDQSRYAKESESLLATLAPKRATAT